MTDNDAKKADDSLRTIEARFAGNHLLRSKAPFNPSTDELFGGIAGLVLPVEQYELLPGLVLSQTFAHVILPAVMAFAPPHKPHAPHPGPWAALTEQGMEISAQLSLAPGEPPLGFDRLNTLWFVTAMLRLRLASPLLMAVIADRPFRDVSKDTEVAHLIPVELHPRQLRTGKALPPALSDLEWLKDHIVAASQLMKDSTFNRVVQTLDSVINVAHAGSGILIAWAAIEALLRPGRNRITDRVCKGLAAYLYPPCADRDRAYPKIISSYEARGGAVHAGDLPEAEQLEFAFNLARHAVSTAIEAGALPDIDVLLGRWSAKT
ncbi:MAG TPA: hypothetical protein VGT78_05370 [Rhizomicrobium sp.]|nr:hypothetical protein [Rhizomicrobium sp.]